MIVLLAALAGFALGWRRAGRARGDRKDRWQWAFAHALAFAMLGLFATIFIDRSL